MLMRDVPSPSADKFRHRPHYAVFADSDRSLDFVDFTVIVTEENLQHHRAMPDDQHVPLPGDPQRQADATLRAYHYQIWQTVLAWMQLAPDQRLWVEQAEDFDVTGPTGASTVQVSHSVRKVTLRDDKIREAIANYWLLKERTPGRPIHFRYITRGEAGMESGQPFGMGVGGLTQWAVAARDLGTARKLLDFLKSERSHFPASLQTFLDGGSPTDAIQTLFVPLTFELGGGDTEAVQRAVDVHLAVAAQASGIMAAAAIRTRPALFARVCAVAGQPSDRWLTHADLQVELAAGAAVVMRPEFESFMRQAVELNTAVRDLLGSHSAFGAVLEAPLTPPRDFTQRKTVLSALRGKLRECQVVFAQGSAGMGKTTLAKFLAAQEPDVWQWVAMAGLRGEAVVQKLRALGAQVARSPAAPHLIVDDVDVSASIQAPLDDALAAMAMLLRQRGGEMLITTQAIPSTRLIDACGTDTSPVYRVPIMSEQETQNLAVLLGCPEGEKLELWGKFAWLQSQGHPQLGRAVLLDAKARDWPTNPVETGVSTSRANSVRTEARRLVASLPESEKEMLFRLSLVGGRFRREHALRIASEPPPLTRPGEAFDPLVGAWIEPMAESTYRVSPLLSDAAKEVYDAERVRSIRVQIAKALLHQNPSPSEGALAFEQAWEARHEDALGGLTLSLLQQPPDIMGPVAFHLAWFASESSLEGEQLFPENPRLSTTLRLLQLTVAAEVVPSRGATILRAWFAEIERLSEPGNQQATKFMAVTEALRHSDLPLPAHDVVEYLGFLFDARDRREAVHVFTEEQMRRVDLDSASEFRYSDFAELQTVLSLNRCRSVAWLNEWLTALESLDETRRERLLAALRRNGWRCGVMIDAAWLDEELKSAPDWTRCLQVLNRTKVLAARWAVPALTFAAVRASAVIQDEYQHEPRTALQNLDDFLALHDNPPPRLMDARAAVLFHLGDYVGAVAEWDALLPTWHAENSQDRYPSFACRTRAIALSRLGDFTRAAQGFIDACNRLPKETESPQNAGLLADAALCFWKADERERAVAVLADAVRAADKLPAGQSDLLAFRMRRVVGHIVSVLHNQVTDWSVENQVEPPIGFASDLAAPDKFRELTEGPFEYVWVLLVRLGNVLNQTIEAPTTDPPELQSRPWTISRFFAGRTAIETACRQGRLQDLPRLAAALDQEWIQAQEIIRELKAARNEQHVNDPVKTGWESEMAGEILFRVGLVVAVAQGTLHVTADAWRIDPVALQWGDAFRAWLSGSLAMFDLPLLEACHRLRDGVAALSANEGTLLAARVAADIEASPLDSARSHVQLLLALAPSFWRIATGFALSELFEQIWRHHARNTALLRAPRLTVPTLLEACGAKVPGFAKAAGIALAALPMVELKVSSSMREDLRLLRENELSLGQLSDPFAAFAANDVQET